MFALVEAIWYSFLIFLKIAFWPAIIIISVALISRLFGTISRAIKNGNKKK